MGDIAGGSRFVAGCARCLRTALAAPDPGPAPEESAESEIGPEYEADSSWTGMVEDSGPCGVC